MFNAPCGSVDHRIHRRLFLQGSLGTAVSVASFQALFSSPAFAESAKARGKKVILLWLCGAPSQFETWDPKVGRPSSGPFGTTQTNVPGLRISDLMPRCATIMDKLTVVRSMSTDQNEHFQAIDLLTRGESPRPPFTRPLMGSVIAKHLGQLDSPVPQFVLLDPCPEGNEFKAFKDANWAGWLGAEYGPVRFGGKYKIENTNLPEGLGEAEHADREAVRSFLSKKFENDRKAASIGSYNAVFERVRGLMKAAPLFDLAALPQSDRDRYGPGTFGMHTLLARHLIENGTTFAMVANGMPWDCHVLNHETHQMLVPELDRIVFELVRDLEDRSMLDDTLVLIMGEFGRTPWLNDARGRDHYAKAWSMAMIGCGIKPGVVYGATDADGIEVTENPIDQRRLFATIYQALGLDPHEEYVLPDFPSFYRVEQDAAPVSELLA